MYPADRSVRSHRLPGLATWWRQAICFALTATLAFAALSRPVITFHSHVDQHAPNAHHAGPVAPEERNIASELEAICLSMDGCHQFGSWIQLDGLSQYVPTNATSLSPTEGWSFTSAFVSGPLRPPTPLAAVPGDEWVSSSCCEVA